MDLSTFEMFVLVEGEENLSAVARKLGINQSNVSRSMKALEEWVGAKLIEPGKITDLSDPKVSIGITEEGRELRDAICRFLEDIDKIRSREAIERGWLKRIDREITFLEDQLILGESNSIKCIELNIQQFRCARDKMTIELGEEFLKKYYDEIRIFVKKYGNAKRNELKRRR